MRMWFSKIKNTTLLGNWSTPHRHTCYVLLFKAMIKTQSSTATKPTSHQSHMVHLELLSHQTSLYVILFKSTQNCNILKLVWSSFSHVAYFFLSQNLKHIKYIQSTSFLHTDGHRTVNAVRNNILSPTSRKWPQFGKGQIKLNIRNKNRRLAVMSYPSGSSVFWGRPGGVTHIWLWLGGLQ